MNGYLLSVKHNFSSHFKLCRFQTAECLNDPSRWQIMCDDIRFDEILFSHRKDYAKQRRAATTISFFIIVYFDY